MKNLCVVLLMSAVIYGCGGNKTSTPPPVISVGVAPATLSTIDSGQTVTFTASVANDSNNRGVTWAVSGTGCTGAACGTMTTVSSTEGRYSAPSTVAADLNVTITATSAADSSKTATSTVLVKPAPSITTTSLPEGTVGSAYTAMLSYTGGVGAGTWSTVGTLPGGLTVSGDGVISGTPTSAGTAAVTFKVTDSAAAPVSAQKDLSITINPAPPITVTIGNKFSTVVPGAAVVTLSASVQNDIGNQGVTWTLTAGGAACSPDCGTLANSTATTVEYTPPVTEPASPADAPIITAVSVADNTKSDSFSFTIAQVDNACGSGNESVLSGEYVFMLNGYAGPAAADYKGYVGTLTFDGTGTITAGSYRFKSGYGGGTGTLGTYSVGADNRGCFTLNQLSLTVRFTLGAITSGVGNRGRIIEFDSPGATAYVATGLLVKRDVTYTDPINGGYAYSATGANSTLAVSMAGMLSADHSVSKSIGEMDLNVGGTLQNLSWDSSNYNDWSGYIDLWPGSNGLFYMYPASSSEIVFAAFVSNAFVTNAFMVGEMRQQSISFNTGALDGIAAFDIASVRDTGTQATIGTFDADGSGTATVALHEASDGVVSSQSVTCGYSVASSGRVLLTGTDCGNGAPILYLTSTNTGYLLDTGAGGGVGRMEAQAAGLFDNSYLSGTFFAGTGAVLSQSVQTEAGFITLDGAGNVSGTMDASSTQAQSANQSFTDTYTVNPDGTFTTGSSEATVVGIIVSGNKLIMLGDPTSPNPSIVKIEK